MITILKLMLFGFFLLGLSFVVCVPGHVVFHTVDYDITMRTAHVALIITIIVVAFCLISFWIGRLRQRLATPAVKDVSTVFKQLIELMSAQDSLDMISLETQDLRHSTDAECTLIKDVLVACQAGKGEAAMRGCQVLIEAKSYAQAWAYHRLYTLKLAAQDDQGALTVIVKGAEVAPHNGQIMLALVQHLLRIGEPDHGLLILKQLKGHKVLTDKALHRLEAVCYLQQADRGLGNDIKRLYEKAIDKDPTLTTAYMGLARYWAAQDKPLKEKKYLGMAGETVLWHCNQCHDDSSQWQIVCPKCQGVDTYQG